MKYKNLLLVFILVISHNRNGLILACGLHFPILLGATRFLGRWACILTIIIVTGLFGIIFVIFFLGFLFLFLVLLIILALCALGLLLWCYILMSMQGYRAVHRTTYEAPLRQSLLHHHQSWNPLILHICFVTVLANRVQYADQEEGDINAGNLEG